MQIKRIKFATGAIQTCFVYKIKIYLVEKLY